MENTIPRSELISIIDWSIPEYMPTALANALREVAHTATHVARTTFSARPQDDPHKVCGCPIVQASDLIGMHDRLGQPGVRYFMRAYDQATAAYSNHYILEVIDG